MLSMEDLPCLRCSFDEEYRYIAALVHRCVQRFRMTHRLPHLMDVEDVRQEALFAIARAWPTFDPSRGEMEGWAWTIAWRTVRDHVSLARHRHEELYADIDIEVDPAPGAEDIVFEDERYQVLIDALRKVPEDRRIVFTLHVLDGFLMSEIAGAMSIPENTAWSRLRATRQAVEQELGRRRARSRLDLSSMAAVLGLDPGGGGGIGAGLATWVGSLFRVATTAKIAVACATSFALGTGTHALITARREAARATSPMPAVLVVRPPAASAAPPAAVPSADVPELIVPPIIVTSVAPRVAPSATASADSEVDDVARQDNTLIRKADAALKRGDLDLARDALERHARSFPGSANAPWRDLLLQRLHEMEVKRDE